MPFKKTKTKKKKTEKGPKRFRFKKMKISFSVFLKKKMESKATKKTIVLFFILLKFDVQNITFLYKDLHFTVAVRTGKS